MSLSGCIFITHEPKSVYDSTTDKADIYYSTITKMLLIKNNTKTKLTNLVNNPRKLHNGKWASISTGGNLYITKQPINTLKDYTSSEIKLNIYSSYYSQYSDELTILYTNGSRILFSNVTKPTQYLKTDISILRSKTGKYILVSLDKVPKALAKGIFEGWTKTHDGDI